MRKILAIGVGLGVSAASVVASAQGFSSVDAINRCDAFVEFALREDFTESGKQPFKVSCYFSLMDAEIHQDPDGVCTRGAEVFASPLREIADFVCKGTYRTYLDEAARAQ